MTSLSAQRDRMVKEHLINRGITDPAVLAAMMLVPREEFVDSYLREFAYDDNPLPIQEGQTISQPYMVGYMAEALQLSPDDRVLEIGTGSGYAAAVLSRIVHDVYTVEKYEILVRNARSRFERLGYNNIHVLQGDGSLGWRDYAPFDAIVVTAGAPDVPQPLLDQLGVGATMVIPVGPHLYTQMLIRIRRETEIDYSREELFDVRFVPLVGAAAWHL